MEYFLEVPNANAVVDYFERNSDVYDEFVVEFKDFTTVEIIFFTELLSEEEKQDHMETIKGVIFNGKL
jgi:hypothetical protein